MKIRKYLTLILVILMFLGISVNADSSGYYTTSSSLIDGGCTKTGFNPYMIDSSGSTAANFTTQTIGTIQFYSPVDINYGIIIASSPLTCKFYNGTSLLGTNAIGNGTSINYMSVTKIEVVIAANVNVTEIDFYKVLSIPSLNLSSTRDTITANWGSISNASGYSIFLDGRLIETVASNKFSYTITELNANTNYDVKIVANPNFGYLGSYNEKTIKTKDYYLGAPSLTVSNISYESFKINWANLPDTKHYEVFFNGNTYTTGNNYYDISGLKDGITYTAMVRQVNVANKISEWATVNAKTKEYVSQAPTLTVTDILHNSAKLNISPVDDTKHYEVVMGTETFTTTELNHVFENLSLNTEYSISVRQLNIKDKLSDWSKVTFKTLSEPPFPPDTPSAVNVIDLQKYYVEVEVQSVEYADSYNYYLNNILIANAGTTYKFTGLTPETAYTIMVKSVNEFGESRFGKVRMVTTLDRGVPAVTDISNRYTPTPTGGGGNPTKQTIGWNTQNTDKVKLIIDGKEIGIFDSDKTTDIDFDSLGLEGDTHEIEVQPYPMTPDSKTCKIKVMSKGTGNQDLDKVLSNFNDANNVIKKAGKYVLMFIIVICILFFGAAWLFNKWKLSLVTKNPEQLEADPDIVMKNDLVKKNELDRESYKAADKEEDSYFERKETINPETGEVKRNRFEREREQYLAFKKHQEEKKKGSGKDKDKPNNRASRKNANSSNRSSKDSTKDTISNPMELLKNSDGKKQSFLDFMKENALHSVVDTALGTKKGSNKKGQRKAKAGTVERLEQIKRQNTNLFGKVDEKKVLETYQNEVIDFETRKKKQKELNGYNSKIFNETLDKLEGRNKS